MPPKLKKRRQMKEDSSSTKWFDLPFEMREMVIDKMDAKTRCRFAQCSKLCEDEVKGSKNHVCAIKIVDSVHKDLYIGYNPYRFHYCLRFYKNDVKGEPMSVVSYISISPITGKPRNYSKWEKSVDGTPEELMNKYAKEIIDKYKKSIKKVLISDKNDTFSLADIDLKCLRNLECIEMLSKADDRDVVRTGLMSMEQIYRTKLVFLPGTRVTYEDIKKFKGSCYMVKSNEFKEENIVEYLKMVKNGEMQRKNGFVSVQLENNEKIDGRKITEGLDVLEYIEAAEISSFTFRLKYQQTGKEGVCQVCFASHIISVFCF